MLSRKHMLPTRSCKIEFPRVTGGLDDPGGLIRAGPFSLESEYRKPFHCEQEKWPDPAVLPTSRTPPYSRVLSTGVTRPPPLPAAAPGSPRRWARAEPDLSVSVSRSCPPSASGCTQCPRRKHGGRDRRQNSRPSGRESCKSDSAAPSRGGWRGEVVPTASALDLLAYV